MHPANESENKSLVERLYANGECGWFFLCFFILTLLLMGFFRHPDFLFYDPAVSGPRILEMQLAFGAEKFKSVLRGWSELYNFKESVKRIDYFYPPVYAALLISGYAWARGVARPGRWDRFFFWAPMAAAVCDWVENSLHLYLLKDVANVVDLQTANLPEPLVVAASIFALIKWVLVALSLAALALLLCKRLFWFFRNIVSVWKSTPGRALRFLPYVYLLRTSMLSALALAGLPFLACFTGARSLLENLFDLSGQGVFWASLAAFLLAWTTMTTARLCLLYGPRRFKVTPFAGKTFGWGYFILNGLIATPMALTIIIMSRNVPVIEATLLALTGLVAALILLYVAACLQMALTPPPPVGAAELQNGSDKRVDLVLPSTFPGQPQLRGAYAADLPTLTRRVTDRLLRIPPQLGLGYIDYQQGQVLPGHLLAFSLMAVMSIVYIWMGIPGYRHISESILVRFLPYLFSLLLLLAVLALGRRLPRWLTAGMVGLFLIGLFNHGRIEIPALSYLLWLFLILSWAVSGVSFFFDRYRTPVIIPLALWLTLTAQFPWSDHYYHLISMGTPPAQATAAAATDRMSTRSGSRAENEPAPKATPPADNQPLTPTQVLQAVQKKEAMSEDTPLILVAVSGGGIQAAAWAARVLTGLEEENPGKFGRHTRLISSVSGGSVGAMYFANAYQGDGGLDPMALRGVVEQAMHSSINAVGWGIVYPDFIRLVCPPCVPLLGDVDRGQALETAWLKAAGNAAPTLEHATLSKWKEDVSQGRRPAVIFNTTITDTGERLLLATSAPTRSRGNKGENPLDDEGTEQIRQGSRSFSDLYPNYDLSVATAARLSASFPYASPAARADLSGPQFHVVDGGYYDNFGISSLVQWLQEALAGSEGGVIRRVLILQIRAFPIDNETMTPQKQPATRRGWFYQAFAPVSTLLNVRTAGQSARNEVELDLLEQALKNRDIAVETAEFEFRSPMAYPGCKSFDKNYAPPLSWHLTQKQKTEIYQEWTRIMHCTEAVKVKNFLASTQDRTE
jgi:hypothetical protein